MANHTIISFLIFVINALKARKQIFLFFFQIFPYRFTLYYINSRQHYQYYYANHNYKSTIFYCQKRLLYYSLHKSSFFQLTH